MTSARDTPIARPLSGHRLSVSSGMSGSAASRLQHPRTHSHSLSVGSLNPTHRVSRRKSTSASAVNNHAAMVAALREASGAAHTDGSAYGNGSGSGSGSGSGALSSSAKRAGLSKPSAAAKHSSHPSLPSSLPIHDSSAFGHAGYSAGEAKSGSVVTDGPSLLSMADKDKGKARVRRASDGSRLAKADKRNNAAELKCETCGKAYKHSSCLTKHLWEHTPEWAITSKLLISKHQQVQLLEAASVLVGMNLDGPAVESDHSSASPAASGSSDAHDGVSSVDTTPPPDANGPYSLRPDSDKRYSAASSAYSRSYQSVFSDEGAHGRPYMSHVRQWSTDGRPTTSGTSVTGSYQEHEEHDRLADALNVLSCSFGTPKTGPVMLPPDVPPVPPLPAKYGGQKPDLLSSSTTTATPHYHSVAGRNFASGVEHRQADGDDASMADDDDDDGDERYPHAAPQHEYEEAFFGKMEE